MIARKSGRNKKQESKHALAARRRRRLGATVAAEEEMVHSLRKKGWQLSEDGPTCVPRRWTKDALSTESIYEACNLQKQLERKQKQDEQKEKIDYLVSNGWRWSEVKKKWERLHWEKVVQIGESAYYVANLNKAYRLQKKLDLIPILGSNWWDKR
jgi:hypothetical protein